MKTETLFISDLHLSLDKPELTRQFLACVQTRAAQAAQLYILGDLFDAWVGDDDWTPPNKSIKTHLKTLIAGGTEVYIQTGNRDFLLGQAFCQAIGATLLGDYALIELNGQIAQRFVLPQWLPEYLELLSWTDAGYFWEPFKA